jgi:general secretion pathway protein L
MRRVLGWWLKSFLSKLPSHLAESLTADRSRLLLYITDGQLLVFHSTAREYTCVEHLPFNEAILNDHDWLDVLGKLSATNLPRFLILSDKKVLTKTLSVPQEVENNLTDFFSFDMDKLTSVSLDDVHFDYRIIFRDNLSKKISVKLFVVKRAEIDFILQKLPPALSVQGVDVHDKKIDDHIFLQGINLLPLQKRQAFLSKAVKINLALTFIVIFFMFSGQMLSLGVKQKSLGFKKEQLASIYEESKQVSNLQEEVNELKETAHYITEKKLQANSITEILYRLTQALPDHTHLEQLQVKSNEVYIKGFSSEAAKLIPILEAAPWFVRATLRASIAKDKQKNKESFAIRVEVKEGAWLKKQENIGDNSSFDLKEVSEATEVGVE